VTVTMIHIIFTTSTNNIIVLESLESDLSIKWVRWGGIFQWYTFHSETSRRCCTDFI